MVVPKASEIQALPLINLVDQACLAGLAAQTKIISAPKKTVLYKSNTPFNFMIYVASGTLRATEVGSDGRVSSVVNIPSGQLIGLMYLYAKKLRLDTLQSIEDSVVWLLSNSEVESALLQSPPAMKRYCQLLIDSMHSLHKDRLSLLMERADNRILGVLAKYAQKHNQDLFLVNLPTQQALADLSNTSRETVSRVVNKLFQDGHLMKEKEGIKVKNPVFLKYFL